MNKAEVISLLRLLEDPDENIYQMIKDKILDNSEMFKIYLENYHSLSIDTLALERSESMLDEIYFNEFKLKLNEYLTNVNSNLLDGALLLETYFNRDVDTKQLKITCEEIIRSIWLEVHDELTAIEKIQIINRILFKNYNFKKYPIGEFRQEQLSFTNCISYKKYISPTIALLYCIILKQLNIPVYPIEIPGIFLLAYIDKDVANSIHKNESNNGIIFYMHPYDEGGFVAPQVVEKYIKIHNLFLSLNEIGILTYDDFLFYLFRLRITAAKQNNTDSFEAKYADRVLDFINKNKYPF